ncbi:energy transducer TonB [Hymenobacter sp. BT491]|uniref:energy transducer TonB n=1 Tax=Hymenobacter sp. BT491 TaxID=2766779 RepID=UPI0016536573|nr:energy transducer TonB [Hymenobacter sp. BT491]MBC6990661.1 TonB family protein [Hymenobacter sp. BT491]
MKSRLVALFVCLVAPWAAAAQNMPAVYLNDRDEATVPDSATHYRLIERKNESAGTYAIQEYSLAGQLLLRGTFSTIEPPVRSGQFTWYYANGARASQVHYRDDEADGVYVAWYEDGKVSNRGEYDNGQRVGRWVSVHRNGQKRSEGHYVAGRPHGEWRYYYNTGQLSAIEQLDKGRSMGTVFYNADGTHAAATVERRQVPQFPGGEAGLLQYLARNAVYPKAARRKNITGKVYVSYTVGEDGRVSHVQVVRGLAPDVDNEARRVVANMPAFLPGREYNVPTAMTFTLPIYFAPNFTIFGGTRPRQVPPTEALAGIPEEIF